MSEKRLYVVFTHVGRFETWATSPRRAIANVRFRLFRRSPAASRYTWSWTVRECA